MMRSIGYKKKKKKKKLLCLVFCFVWWPGMAINVSVKYNGGFLPDIILLTQGYYLRGTHLNIMEEVFKEKSERT